MTLASVVAVQSGRPSLGMDETLGRAAAAVTVGRAPWVSAITDRT